MTTREKVLALATKIGAEVASQVFGDTFEVRVTAPEGRRWVDGGHELVARTWGPPWTRREAWVDVYARMGRGTLPCKEGCEYWEKLAREGGVG